MLQISVSTKFKKDAKKLQSSVLDEVEQVLNMLCEEKELPTKYRPHILIGNYKGYTECHIRPDVLLIYRTDIEYLYLYRIGSHANLFS